MNVLIGKANYDLCTYDTRHLAGSEWLNPPKFDKIKKASELFKSKKRANYEKIYTILISRSDELRGDTKMSNERLAALLKISTRQVIRAIKFLEKNRLIAVLKKCYNANGVYKTVRVIRVWLTYYKNGCNPCYEKVFKNDIRPGKFRELAATKSVPLKFRVWRDFTVYDRVKKERVVMKKEYDFSWFSLLKDGFISYTMSLNITRLEEIGKDNSMRKNVYNILGYNKDFLVYRNTGMKKSDRYKQNTSVKEESERLRRHNASWWG